MHLIVTLHQPILNPEKTKGIQPLKPWSHWCDEVVLRSIFLYTKEANIKYGKRSTQITGNLCPSVR